jgi:hypothetical protein
LTDQKSFDNIPTLFKKMNSLNTGKASIFALAVVATLTAVLLGKSITSAFAVGNPGAIWTTDGSCGDSSQDVNHFDVGDHVFINGSGFDPGTYAWSITGKPGGASSDPNIVVASGNVDPVSGAFCFDAYTIPSGDNGEYHTEVGNKGDNYRVGDEVDVCSNIAGIQVTTPNGFVNNNGVCTPDEETDICPNLEGNEETLPEGYHFETTDNGVECVPDSTPSPSPTATPSNGDVCLNLDGIQTSVPSDLHLGADGTSCVSFSVPGVPESPAVGGQVLGASTMAGAGSFAESLYMAIMGLGGTLSTAGFVLSKKLSKKA